jgi:L-ectoine synthase
MKIIGIHSLSGTERDVAFPTGMRSVRALLARDGMGFSMHKTIIPKGIKHHWHYKHHLEACYCICGWGILTNLATGQQHMIREDMVYVLDKHDDHTFETLEDTVLISVFNPPCTGTEVHTEDGSYAQAEIEHA